MSEIKVLKNGKIEPCCDWSISYLKDFELDGEWETTGIPMIEIETLQHDGDYHFTTLNFCPNCGIETEALK